MTRRARSGVLAAVALIAAAGIIVFGLGARSSPPSPRPHASPSSSGAAAFQHVAPDQAVPPGPLLAGLGAYAGGPPGVNGLGVLLGGRLQYAEAFLPDRQPIAESSAQPVLATWQQTGYQLILGVPLVPLTVPSYAGPPEPGPRPYQLADYPDAVAAFRQGV